MMSKKRVSEKEAESERKAIRKALDETEAPVVAEIRQPKPPRRPSPKGDRQPRRV
jgi:hypothetical protein